MEGHGLWLGPRMDQGEGAAPDGRSHAFRYHPHFLAPPYARPRLTPPLLLDISPETGTACGTGAGGGHPGWPASRRPAPEAAPEAHVGVGARDGEPGWESGSGPGQWAPGCEERPTGTGGLSPVLPRALMQTGKGLLGNTSVELLENFTNGRHIIPPPPPEILLVGPAFSLALRLLKAPAWPSMPLGTGTRCRLPWEAAFRERLWRLSREGPLDHCTQEVLRVWAGDQGLGAILCSPGHTTPMLGLCEVGAHVL